MTDLPDDTKETFMEVLQHASAEGKAVIEFHVEDNTLHAAEITEHVARLEDNQ